MRKVICAMFLSGLHICRVRNVLATVVSPAVILSMISVVQVLPVDAEES